MVLVYLWLGFGALTWIYHFVSFIDLKFARPGLLELLVLSVAGPLPLIHALVERYGSRN